MAKFPRTEAKIMALAQNIITGMTDNADFPAPPVTAAELQAQLDAFTALSGEQTAVQAAAQQITEAKKAACGRMLTSMKTMLRYAENAAQDNGAKLAALGWNRRANKRPCAAPGQALSLEAARQGAGWLHLVWKQPAEGGRVSFYKIERRSAAGGEWLLAGNAIKTEAALKNQERGTTWEYRVAAVNRAGEGEPSNIVTAVM